MGRGKRCSPVPMGRGRGKRCSPVPMGRGPVGPIGAVRPTGAVGPACSLIPRLRCVRSLVSVNQGE